MDKFAELVNIERLCLQTFSMASATCQNPPSRNELESFIEAAHAKLSTPKPEPPLQKTMDKYLDKYIGTPSDLDSKKRKANSPLVTNTTDDIDLDLSFDISETKSKSPVTPQSVENDILDIINNSMEAWKISMDADKLESRDLLKSVESKVNDIHSSMVGQSDAIKKLTEENGMLRARNNVIEGRLTRMEKVVQNLNEDVHQINARSMKDNLIFNNIPETETSSRETKKVLLQFFAEEMDMDPEDIQRVSIKNCHRMGMKGKYARSIVACVNEDGKRTIWSHVKKLKGKKFNIFTQLPRVLSERKKQLVEHYKLAKEAKLDVKWIGEKLLVANRVVEAPRDAIRDIHQDTTGLAASLRVRRAPRKTYNNSTFQGSKVIVDTRDEIVPALHAIYSDLHTARATHNIYAYRLKTEHGVIEHYADDGEHGAGRRLLDLLKGKDVVNQLICVTRWSGGQHLGPARFDHILEAANDII